MTVGEAESSPPLGIETAMEEEPPSQMPQYTQAPRKISRAEQTPPRSDPITNTTPPSAMEAVQPIRKHVISFSDGAEILRQVHRGRIPATWRVLHPLRWKVVTFSILYGLYCFALSATLLFVFLGTIVIALFPLLRDLGVFVATILVLTMPLASAQILYRWRTMNQVLVLLPEGLVLGRGNQQKVVHTIDYLQVVGIKVKRAEVAFDVHPAARQARTIQIKLTAFESPKEVALSVEQAYEKWKRAYPRTL